SKLPFGDVVPVDLVVAAPVERQGRVEPHVPASDDAYSHPVPNCSTGGGEAFRFSPEPVGTTTPLLNLETSGEDVVAEKTTGNFRRSPLSCGSSVGLLR